MWEWNIFAWVWIGQLVRRMWNWILSFYSFSYSSISGEKSSFIFFLKALLLLRFIIIIQFYKFTCFFRKRFFFLSDFLPLFWSCFVQKNLFLHKTQKLLYRIRKTFGYVFLGYCCRFLRMLLLLFSGRCYCFPWMQLFFPRTLLSFFSASAVFVLCFCTKTFRNLYKTQKLLYKICKTFGHAFLGFCCRFPDAVIVFLGCSCCFLRTLLLFSPDVVAVSLGFCRFCFMLLYKNRRKFQHVFSVFSGYILSGPRTFLLFPLSIANRKSCFWRSDCPQMAGFILVRPYVLHAFWG